MHLRIKFHNTIITLLLLGLTVSLFGQDPESNDAAPPDHPLHAYLNEIDEMGRTLSRWKGDSLAGGSWFFGSYAMLLLSNNGAGENVPFPGLEASIPALWSDFKYLTPRYLVELAGGALSHGNLMSITEDLDYESLRTEEQFILEVAGFGYLLMLQGTVGDSLFKQVISETIANSSDPAVLTEALIRATEENCGKALAQQFQKALRSSHWSDVNLKKVRSRQGLMEITIEHLGEWHFPIKVLTISADGDSAYYEYGLSETEPLVIRDTNIKRVELDPHHLLAEYYRYNNRWPRLRDNIAVQPFGALPDWSNYRITINPSYWSDWDGEKRIGIKTVSGFGVDLWPAYPSDYRHRINFEVNAHEPMDSELNWGGRFGYAHPVDLDKRLFSHFLAHTYDDWSGLRLGLTRYVGKQTFLIQGPRLTYQRIGLDIEYDHYSDSLVWRQDQDVRIVKSSYSGLSLTQQGDRVYINVIGALGSGPQGNFSIIKAQTDLNGVFWGWLVGGIQFETGFQSETTPHPFQFTHNYAWQDRLAAIPKFRGQNKLVDNTNEYMGLSISGGYWMSGFQLKVFTSSLIIDMNDQGWNEIKPRYAAGFGFEHTSFFTAGLYFPVWQSQPIDGEYPWSWRVQWRLTWNL